MAENPSLTLAGEPRALALDETSGLAAIILADTPEEDGGRLEIIDLTSGQSIAAVLLANVPQMITADTPGPVQAYVSLDNGVVLVDLQAGQVVNRLSGLGRLRGMARDAATQRLFVADTEGERLLVLRDDLSQQVAALELDRQPNQLIFDSAARQIYLSFPAVPQVIAIDADNLTVTAQASLIGGPIFDLVFDAKRNRLYTLSALAPDYRGITVWRTPTLDPIALVAGTGDFPLRTASAMALTPTGHLLASETTGLWQIAPDDFAISNVYPTANQSPAGGLTVSQSGTIYMLEPASRLLRIY